MEVNFKQELFKADGSPIFWDEKNKKALSLRQICVRALGGMYKQDEGKTDNYKYERGKLAATIMVAKKMDLSVEQITELKELIKRAYDPITVYIAHEMLDPKDKKTDGKKG